MKVLVVNAGSSSLKLRLLGDDDEVLGWADLERGRLDGVIESLGPRPDAVGHRIVHGGMEFREPAVVDERVVERLNALTDLAPLHQPKSLRALADVTRALPDVPAVACFDTAFHATLPAEAATYAVPRDWWRRLHLRRYGFHGLSHAHAARRAPELLGGRVARLVSCHLGAGASLCAIRDGRSVDTTMGFTPLEGLVMATRSGSVDPGLVLWLLQHEDVDAAALEHALEHESGLLALAGTPDMRALLEREDDDARLALAVYLHRLRAGIAAMAASLGGLDALVFTGGVGENAARVRAEAAAGLAFLGVAVDIEANAEARPDVEVTAPDARVRTLVLEAREDLEVARGTRQALGAVG